MRITSLVLALSCSCSLLPATGMSEEAAVDPVPALAPGQAPPLPQAGPLAEPRSSDQAGFPKVLTEYVISPATLTTATVALGQRLFFEPRLSGDGTVACATCHVGSRLHRWQARISRHPRPRRPTQRPHRSKCPL
jgi:cytochrome c peroxidase